MAKPKDTQSLMKQTKLYKLKTDTKIHYLNQSKYIPARNESGATKKHVSPQED